MPYKISNSDYSKILNYYAMPIPKNKTDLKQIAEDMLAQKLCSCIKKLGGPKNEARAIGVCTKSVINKKGLSRGKFKCTKGRKVEITKKVRKMNIGRKQKTQKRR